jgi:hypothetical protein
MAARVNYAYQEEWRAIYRKYMAWICGCYDGNTAYLNVYSINIYDSAISFKGYNLLAKN